MNREQTPAIERLHLVLENCKVLTQDDLIFEALTEAILDLDARFRTHQHNDDNTIAEWNLKKEQEEAKRKAKELQRK